MKNSSNSAARHRLGQIYSTAASVIVIIGTWFSCATTTLAKPVDLPLTINYSAIATILEKEVFTEPGNTARVWDDGSGCNFLVLSQPQVDRFEVLLRVTSKAQALVGARVGERCMVVLRWQGFIETHHQFIADQRKIRIHVVDSRIYEQPGVAASASTTLWEWVKQYVHPRLERAQIDLNPIISEARPVLLGASPVAHRATVRSILESLNITRIEVMPNGVRTNFRLNVPALATAKPRPEQKLTEREVVRFRQTLDQWDAFITFIVKQAANETLNPALRKSLLAILLDTRYDLLAYINAEPRGNEDPIKQLFIRTWRRLAPVLSRVNAGQRGLAAMQYLSFLTAVDILQAIDAAGPELGIDISVDGLRRLARLLAPNTRIDPTEFNDRIDPELRKLFGLNATFKTQQLSNRSNWINLFINAAFAAEGPDKTLLKRLNNWVPQRKDMDVYLPLVGNVLDFVTEQQLNAQNLSAAHRGLFRHLVLATAWQESCWRQFVNQQGKRQPLRSGTGDVGIMQINPRVWRGFYTLHDLKWDLAYNASAGTEILMYYLNDYALRKKEHQKTGNLHNLARATYAAYNGGPRALTRYRNANAPKHLREVDSAFWQKYQAIKKSGRNSVSTCYAK